MFDQENFNVFRDGDAVKNTEKVKRTNLPRKARNFSKEQLQLALKKKKECNSKAQRIVEVLLEPVEDVSEFLLMLRDINQSHFEDVIQERAIMKVCGYPLCQNTLSNIPNQQYVISLSSKKVYDITERKNFCTGQCFKASNYLKEQMLTSPLWLRDQEDIPTFKLLGNDVEPSKEHRQQTSSIEGFNPHDLHIVERPVARESHSGQQEVPGKCDTIREGSEVRMSKFKESRGEASSKRKSELSSAMEQLSLDN
ncbi:putative RNA polymerase II subunit B1 CTD phosphatase RPAP2 homolog [Uranotaenia lowii]|uniref:putative RNA polymerase II subunit B1 CTD phosphatase RPAP2 homolog n=1 Tax=Uranotaenia lowii TaxID=190385 RepID=UPI002479A6BB|nr:putative RNA polymerase II subunit B1 CTD phosphatase RPAP2 homolog [Uranotaenia lowii]